MIKSTSNIRSKQKKIHGIIKELISNEDFSSFCDMIDESLSNNQTSTDALVTDFLFDDEMIQQYEGNVENFIHDIENCFRTFKTITNTQNVVLWNYVKELILESFDDAIFNEEGILDIKDRSDENESPPHKTGKRKSAANNQNETPKSKRKSRSKDFQDDYIHETDSEAQPPTKKSRSKAKSLTGNSLEDKELQKEMLKVIDTLSSNPSYQIFSQPVKIEEAPDYYDVIPYPMDLSTMRTNVVSGKYNENQIIEYAVDMRRIGMNCMDYNLPGSPIYLIAQDYLRSFEVLYQNTFKSIMKRAPKVSSEDHSLIPTPQSKKEKKKTQQPSTPNSSGSVDEKKLQQIKKFFKVIYNHHLAEPFRFPVDLSQAPGYTDLIKRPMDLSQIKKNFEYYADSRANKLIEFYSDLILIFDNCRTYNVEGSTLFNAAEELSDFTQSAFQEHFPGILNSSTPTVPSEVSHINPKTPKSKAKSSSPIDESILTPASKRPPRREKESSITELKDWPDIFIEDKELGNLSISELTQIYNFLQSSEAAQSVAVRERCSQNARKFLKQIQATKSQDGFYSNELYTVANHGTIRTEPSWHSKDYIYPHGYVCRRDLILSVLPLDISVDKEVNPLDYPHIQVTFTTEILEDQNGNPLFRLSVGENILVVESERINQIWNKTFLDTFGEPILRSLGNKFLRCRAILFYLSTCDSVEPFLEQLPVFSTKSYLKVIKAPMWLSEVYDRLIEGMYDNEYDYAWDMRLIFLNSMNYNEVNSEVYCSAQKLMEIFNILFCQWILNIEDFSVFEPAKGLWDDWMTLKYYDARGRSSSEIPEICKITGLAGTTDSPLKFCVSCEDFYHSSVSEGGLSYEDDIDGKIQQLWRCPRCEKMKQALESPQYGSLLPDKRYIRTKIFKSYIYKVANDIGPGWVKATTNTKPNLGKFLSPLGYQFNSKDEALSWMEEEKLLHDKLVSEREEEFIAKQGNPLSQRKKKAKSQRANTRGRKRKQVDLEPESGAETGDVTKEDLGNSNVMLTGKLPHVQYEASRIHFAGLYVPSESEELKMTIFVPENISPSGFSGLDDVIIHQIIEGLPGSNLCRAYQFSDSLQVLDALCKTIRTIIEKKEQRSSADKLLFEKLLYERNYWRNLELNARNQARPPDSKVDSPSTNELMQKYPQYEKKVCQLMIPLVPPEWKFGTITCDEIEFAVHLWEFLHLLNPLVTNQTFGLLDIIKTLASNAIPHFPNPSTIIFDEICCLLTSVLLTETAPFFFSDKQVLQDFLSLHPLNTISWPWVSYLTLYLSSNLRCGRKQYTSDSIMQMFHLVRCFKEESLVLSEFINLLLSHPSFHVQQSSQRSYQENLRYDQFYSKIFSLGFTEQNVTFGAVFDELFSLLTELNDLELLEWFSLLLKHTATFQSAFKEQLSQQVIQSMENSNSTMQATNILSRSVHLNLATSLPVLRLKEPDCYTLSDRMAILHALIQYCSVTPLLSSHNKKIMTELNRDPLSELTNNTSILSPDLQPTPIPKSHKGILKCVFSGIESKNDPHAVEDESEWVTVPSALLQPPTMPSEFASFGESESSNTVEESAIIAQEIPPQPDITEEVSEHDEDLEHANVPKSRGRKKSKSSRDEPVTLKLRLKQPACLRSNLIKIVTARELATREIENMEDYSFYMKTSILNNLKLDYITKTELLSRTVSLGFDRTGREYWLLDEQNRTLIGGYNQTYSQYIDDEPVLLVREPSANTWSYICTSSIHELLDYLSSHFVCERFLYKNISSKIDVTRENLSRTNLKITCSQDPWLSGFRGFEMWFSGLQAMVYNTTNPLDTPRSLKLQELTLARCLEFRLGVHYAFINKVFESHPEEENGTSNESKKKISRHKLLEYVYDCHSTLGWLRHDSYERIRELSANTIAIKLLCDPSFYEFHANNMRKCIFRKKNLHYDEIGPNPRAYIKPISAGSVHTRQAANLLQSHPSKDDVKINVDDEEFDIHHSGSASSKAVEQLHVETGQVLRRWPSGTKAANVLGVSRSGISVCCSGVKEEAFGFKWRFCESNLPPIEEVSIKQLLKMKACYQKSTGTYVGLDDEDTEPEDVAKSTTTSATPATTASRNRPIPTQALLPKSPFNPNRHVPDVVSSVVPVPYRLLKLKIELLNILAILPKGLLSWNRQKNEVKSEHEGTQSSDEDSNLEAREDNEVITEADKQTPEMTVDQYIKEIQNCETYLHLFKLIQLLEKALPLVALFDFPFQLSESVISPTNTLTSSMVATYLYSLDRWIRYEDIPLDFFFEGVDYRPRMIYTPRCILSPTCLKYFHHSGRCDTAISNGDSRYKEILPKGMQVPNQSVKQQMSNQFQKSGSGIFTSLHQLPNPQFGNQARPPGTFNLSSTYCSDPEVLTLDSIQPYIPRKDQIKDSAWV